MDILRLILVLLTPILLFAVYTLGRIMYMVLKYQLKKGHFDSLPRLGGRKYLHLSGLAMQDYYPEIAEQLPKAFPDGIPPLIYAGPGLTGDPVVLVNDLAGIKLVSDDRVFLKAELSYSLLGVLIGNGLVTSSGEFWHSQRNLINPWFHPGKLKEFYTIMAKNGEKMVAKIKKNGGKPTGVVDVMGEVTQSILIDAMFTGKIDATWMHDAWHAVNEAMNSFFLWGFLLGSTVNRFPLFPWTRAANNTRNALKSKILTLINDAIAHGGNPDGDFIEYLVANGCSADVVFEEAMTMLFAGHDTTKNTLAWLMYFLGKQPEMLQKLQQEVDTELKGASPTIDDFHKLRLCRFAIMETLRMRPPAPSLERQAAKDTSLGGFPIPKDTHIMYYLYGPLMDPKYWKDPLTFNPERFADDEHFTAHFTPFSMGVRNCIGQKFAIQEGVILAAQLIQNFDIQFCNEFPVKAVFEGTMLPKGLHCKFIERKTHA